MFPYTSFKSSLIPSWPSPIPSWSRGLGLNIGLATGNPLTQPCSSGKIFAKFGLFATSLHRYFATTQKMLSEKNTPLLHRYFATTFQKLDSEPSEKCPPKKITPSLHCYFATTLPKNALRKKLPPRYIATSLQPPEKWPPKKNTPKLHRYFATTFRKSFP